MKQGSRFFVASCLLAASYNCALAQAPEATLLKLAGTREVHFEPLNADGALAGCSLVYTAIMQDTAYRQGEFVIINGNVSVMVLNGTPAVSVKVVLNDIDYAKQQLTPGSVGRVYLVGKDYKTNLSTLVKNVPSDTPGGVAALFGAFPSFEMIMESMGSNTITIAYSRNPGRVDLQLPLELDVVETDDGGKRTRSEVAKHKFNECTIALLDQASK